MEVKVGNGCIVEGVKGVSMEVLKVFEERFKEPLLVRPELNNAGFKKLSEEERNSLEADFSREEIRLAMWDSGGEKSPGPDGYNIKFIQECWDFLQEDIYKLVEEFHKSASLPKTIIASFIALIPKIVNPQGLNKFRPICLIGCLYKIVS